MYTLYIIKCADDSLYTGITTDIHRRIDQHNGNTIGGPKYTRGRRPVELVYTEKLPNRSEATKREQEIKKMTRTKKEKLIG